MPRKPEIIAEGIFLPEGPVWCPDGTLVVTAVAEGALYRIWPAQRRKEKIADVEGGANSAALASDGGFIVTQNGGLDFVAMGLGDHWPKPRYVSPGLQRVKPDGTVVRLLSGMQAPNDLVVSPDGTVFFTDPLSVHPLPPGSRDGRLMAYSTKGDLRLVTGDFRQINGVIRERSGDLVVTEENGLMRVEPDGRKTWIIENIAEKHATDGLALDADGRIYAAGALDCGIRVVENGRVVEFWELPDSVLITNCCFGGPDNRWLFVTEGLPGRVFLYTDMPAPGASVYTWPVPPG
jgi:gluconolactonase